MNEWKKVRIDFDTIKLKEFIEPIKTTVAETKLQNPIAYGVTNVDGITQTGKPASDDLSKYIVLENNCFAFNPYRINVGSIGINNKNLIGCVSPAYVVFKTKNGLHPKFLFHYLKSDYGNHLINWYGNKGGVRNALRYDDLCNIDIPNIKQIDQEKLLQKLDSLEHLEKELLAENEHQKDYAKKLRQNILQDAIQGTLTKEWRKENEKKLKNETNNPDYNATALFEKIQKIKKGEVSPSLQSAKHSSATPSAGSNAARNARLKQYSPITEEEKSFEIPNNWKWVRLGEIANKITDGTHNSPINTSTGDFMYVTAKNIKSTGVDLSNITFITSKIHNEIYSRCNVEYGDLLFIKDGATTGIVCLNNLKEQFSLLSSVALIKTSLNNNYLKTIMGSPFFYNQTRQNMYGVAIPRVTLQKIENAIIPLPPLLEQKEIVSKVEQLLSKVEEIEKEIENRATIIKQITQSTLKDAFNVR